MHRKNIYKIGLSLLIALAFILPTAGTMAATDEKEKASVNTGVDDIINLNNLGAQDPNDVWITPELISPEVDSQHRLVGGCYPITIGINNDESTTPATVKAFVDIYKKSSGVDVVMYETSFEDNFDIYNNWIQIDADCGVIGGQFDSWSWSDARAYCDDHSMKSTMYDIYKGNQDDYLQCTRSFDISDQDAVRFEFIAWVQGDYNLDDQYEFITPYDYLDFEIGDQNSNVEDDWMNPYVGNTFYYAGVDPGLPSYYGPDLMPGSYYFPYTDWTLYNYRFYIDYTDYVEDLGDGWWKITYEVPTAVLAADFDVTDIMFRFSWHSDPEFQFEGAYVDCVKVISVESMEEKVFQSHSQGEFIVPVTGQGTCYEYTFPMEWCVEAPADPKDEDQYDVRLWLEVIDAGHQSIDDWNSYVDLYVIVTEWFDITVDCMAIESSYDQEIILDTCDPAVPDSDITMMYGDDAHIMTTIHAGGTIPATDIAVTAAAYPKSWETLLESDFEALVQPFNDMYGNAHITERDAYSGEKSLGFFNEEFGVYENNEFDYAASAAKIDFIEGEHIYMDWYWKGLTEPYVGGPAATRGTFAVPFLMDPEANTLLGMSTGGATRMTGYQPDWIGPCQPSCRYVRVDVTAYYNTFLTATGYLRDSHGNPVDAAGIGFYFSSDDGPNYNPTAEAQGIMWSGIFIDDIKVYKQAIAEDPVWSQTIIIPGPLEPCETADIQFEWEDLPFCDYLIEITSSADGACGNLEDNMESAQIHVYANLERASDKEMETIDYTAIDNGQFGISSSDYDNYIASNADYHRYAADQNSVMQLCIDGEKCFDISTLADQNLYFDAWFETEYFWDYFQIEVAACGADDWTDWYPLNFYSQAAPWTPIVPAFPDMLTGPSSMWDTTGNPDGWFLQSEGNGVYCALGEQLANTGTNIELRLHFVSDGGYNMRGIKLDNFHIYETHVPEVFLLNDPCDNLDNWCPQGPWSYGSFWTYDDVLNQWCWDDPVAAPYQDAIIWSTEILDAYMATFCFDYFNNLVTGEVSAEVSGDGGLTWSEICRFTSTYRYGGWFTYCYDLSQYIGKQIMVRFTAQPDDYVAGTTVSGKFCIRELRILGKTDNFAPTTTISMSGTMKESGWYTTPVKVVITATDIGGAGMGEIHYILDGVEKVVAGNKAEFTVSGNGDHTVEYWGVDAAGNVETPHHIAPSFKIDSGAKPTVSISAPTPGIYFNGKKLLSSSNTIIIGGFTAEATATDADSGIYKVSFYLDDQIVAEDTTSPFSAYICQKHMGAATLKVVAEDFAQNTAEASMTLKYFKFF